MSFGARHNFAVAQCLRYGIHPDVVSYSSVGAAALAAVCFWQVAACAVSAAGRAAVLLRAAVVQHARRHGGPGFRQSQSARRDRQRTARSRIGRLDLRRSRTQRLLLGVQRLLGGDLGTADGLRWHARPGGRAQREFSGPMSKPWRMVVLHCGTWSAFFVVWRGFQPHVLWKLTVLDLTCLVIITGCVLTVIIRLRRICRTLDANQSASCPCKNVRRRKFDVSD